MRRESWRQGAVGWVFLGGSALIILGAIVTYALFAGSVHSATRTRDPATGAPGDMGVGVLVPLGLLIVLAGVILVVGALGYGLYEARTENIGVRREIPGAFVVARYAISKNGIYMSDPFDIEHADEPKFYVRLALPGEEAMEFNTAEETFWWAGEGMRGTAEISGKWLGRFAPDVGTGTGHISTIV